MCHSGPQGGPFRKRAPSMTLALHIHQATYFILSKSWDEFVRESFMLMYIPCLPGTIPPMLNRQWHIPVADPEGAPWVAWKPSFEVLPSKILWANVRHTLRTLELRTSASTVTITHVRQLLYQASEPTCMGSSN